MIIGQNYPPAPPVIAGYTYAGKYKKSTNGSDPQTNAFESGTPSFTYDGSFDTYKVNYYYDKNAVSTDGKIIIKHFDMAGKSLNGVAGLNDREEPLKAGQSYSFNHATKDNPTSGYAYSGYKKSTNGSLPSGSVTAGEYNLGTYTQPPFGDTVYLYYYYDALKSSGDGTILIRHFDEEGHSLDGVGGLHDKQQTLKAGQTYASADFAHDDADGYTYSGYKKSTSGVTPSGTILSGEYALGQYKIPPFTDTVYLYHYYKAKPGPSNFTGDFDVTPGKIAYKDPFKFHPKDFKLNGCTYTSHLWKIERDGLVWTSSTMTNQYGDTSFTYPGYPSLLGIGVQNVYMKITTSCGESPWIGPKTLEITGPANNHPPTFQIGFVDPGNPRVPLHRITEGSILNLVVIQDPTIPTPNDPDGDTITFNGFDFAADDSWIKSIPSKGQDHYLEYVNIPMDGPGYHTITATMKDPFGAVATASTYIEIVPPNPVAVIDGPDRVVQGRPLSEPFKGDRSYSPIPARTINHARDEWTNVKNVYATPGKETIKLDVYDSLGLKSLNPGVHELTVLADLPPVPVLEYSSPSIRGANVAFANQSYSPDGDKLVQNSVSFRYDKDNDGNFTEESSVSITMNAKNEFTFTPTRVGHYKFYVNLKEDWGKTASGEFDFEVINDAPSVAFDISTESRNPAPIVPIPLKGSSLTDPAGVWKNSDFKNASKGSSWNYNTATGALVHSPTDYGRFSTSIAPTKNVSVVDLHEYAYYTDISATYISGSDWDLGGGYFARHELTADRGSETTRIYHVDASGTLTLAAMHDNVVRVIGVDSINQLVYALGYNDGLSGSSIATYRISSFISPSGVPMTVSYQANINGQRMDTTPSLILSKYFPSAFGDVMYTQTYLGIGYSSGEKRLFDWGTDTPAKTISYGNMWSSTSSVFNYAGLASIPDLKMRFHFYSNYNYYMFDPVTDANEYSGASPSTGDLRDDMLSTSYPLYPTYDGKYVVSGQGKVYQTSDQRRVFTLTGGTYNSIYGVTPSNIAYGYLGNILKGFTVNSNGSLTQIWNYIPVAGTTIDAYLADNSDGLIILERSSTTSSIISRIDLTTGNKTVITALNPTTRTGAQPAVLSLQDDGKMKVAFVQSGYTPGKSRYNQTFLISSADHTSRNEALSSQNQLLNSSLHLKNIMINYKMKMNLGVGGGVFSGFSFGAQDHSNMYRVEHNLEKIQLVKVVGGHRTVIKSVPFAFKMYQAYPVKITALDNRIKVYVDGVPLIDTTDPDATFGDGSFGPFSEIPRTEFTSMSYADLKDLSITSKLQGVALVGQDMIYTITNDDTENDPMIKDLTEWTYTKVKEKFLDAGDGKSGPSASNGIAYKTPLGKLDKVGVYEVSYKTVDDPNSDYLYPSGMFGAYRQPSNKAVRTLIVHRPPIVDYDIGLNADRTVKWTDRSRDPDRYLSAANYSKEATGIDYLKSKGITEKKFYYMTPSGKFVEQKLVTPTEVGTYTVGLAVKDEYNAWSDFLEKTIAIGALPSPDEPPHAGFTNPATAYRGDPVTINSTAWDKEDGARDNLPHEYYLQSLSDGSETMASNSRTSWTKTFSTMGKFQFRQTVEDHVGQVDTVSHAIDVVNRIPVASIYIPSSTDQNRPDKFTVTKPVMKWNYGDSDNDPETKYQVKVYRYGGVLEQDSGVKNGNALNWTPGADLPERVNMYVVVRVFDGYDWSSYSDPRFFYIETNRPPTGDFDWQPKPVYEGDSIRFTHAVGDPDHDALSVSYTITDPDGVPASYAYTVADPYSNSSGPQFIGEKVGTYKAKMTISDGKAPPVAVSKDIVVLPLAVAGEVRHTDLWDERRIAFNRKESGSDDQPRAYSVFWAGERFLLRASTTDTLTDTDAVSVKVTMDGRTVSLTASDPSRSSWSGEMWETDFEKLPDGPLTFAFKATYSNGTVKAATATIVIASNMQQTVGVHRRQ